MGDDEAVSRRDLFAGWARGLRDGLAEWVLPELEQQAERIREAFETPEPDDRSGTGTVHPWRDLLEPPEDRVPPEPRPEELPEPRPEEPPEPRPEPPQEREEE